jgi:hypothetical protein
MQPTESRRPVYCGLCGLSKTSIVVHACPATFVERKRRVIHVLANLFPGFCGIGDSGDCSRFDETPQKVSHGLLAAGREIAQICFEIVPRLQGPILIEWDIPAEVPGTQMRYRIPVKCQQSKRPSQALKMVKNAPFAPGRPQESVVLAVKTTTEKTQTAFICAQRKDGSRFFVKKKAG